MKAQTAELAIAQTIAAAERVLARTYARDVRLGDVVRISDDDRRNLLLRCRDVSDGGSASFIIKKVVADTYDPEDATSFDTTRFFSDWAGAEFLSSAIHALRSPRFYGGDRARGFFVLEDLGDHRSLVEPLLEEDAASAEKGLLAFTACLGAVHAGTAGQSSQFEQLLRGLNPHVGTYAPALTGLAGHVVDLQLRLGGLGVRVGNDFSEDVAAVIAAIEKPGPFLSYIHGDPCPDNVFWNGEQLRVIDFEFGGLGHALADAAYGRMLFPSCWCANRLPQDLISRMEAVYRAELATGCAQAQEDRIFEAALAGACGFWLLSTLSRSLSKVLDADSTWGIGTVRQRVLSRLESFIATAEEFDQLPGLRSVASQLLDVLRRSWPDVAPLPLYPAFQRASSRS